MPACLSKQKAGSCGIWSVGQILLLRSQKERHTEDFPARMFLSGALRGTSHESLCFWNCTNKNLNTLAVWFQELPRKIWSIEFTLPQNSWKCCHSCFGSAKWIIQHFTHCVHTLSKERSVVKGCFSLLCVWFGVINSNDTSSRIIFCTLALFIWFWDIYLEKSIRCTDVMIRWGKKSAC